MNRHLLALFAIAALFLSACKDTPKDEGFGDEAGIGNTDLGIGNLNDPTLNNGTTPWGNEGGILNGADAFGTRITGWQFPTVYFAYDSDNLGQSGITTLNATASYLQENPTVGVIIEGNSDDRGTEEYNRALGERRAISVRNFLTAKGISEARFKTISYGEDRPAVQGSGEGAWAKNRRAELLPVRLNP